MNNYCWFCGKKINKDDLKCRNCEARIFENRVDVEERKISDARIKKEENTMFFISLVLPVLACVTMIVDLQILSPIFAVAFLIMLATLRKKFHYSLKIKILSWLTLIIFILAIIFIIWICIECGIIHPGLKGLYV